jgi:hypothetical protein
MRRVRLLAPELPARELEVRDDANGERAARLNRQLEVGMLKPEADVEGQIIVALPRILHRSNVARTQIEQIRFTTGLESATLKLECTRQRGNDQMATGKTPASKAGKELGSGKSSKSERVVAASDLAQAPRKPKKK